MLIATTALFLLLNPLLVERFQVTRGEQAVEYRISDLERGVAISQEFPLLGVGLGNYVQHFQASEPNLSFWRYEPIHNVYLLILVETGIIGFTLFMAFLFFLLRQAYKKLKKSLELAYVASAILAVSFLVLMFFDHYLWTLQQGTLMLWLMLGIVSALGKEKNPSI